MARLQAAWIWSQSDFRNLPVLDPTGCYYQYDSNQLQSSCLAYIGASMLGMNSPNGDYHELDRYLDDRMLVEQLKSAGIYRFEQLKEFARQSPQEKRSFLVTALHISQFRAQTMVWKITEALRGH